VKIKSIYGLKNEFLLSFSKYKFNVKNKVEISSISKSSTKKSRNAIKYNSFNNYEFYKKKKISNKLIKKFLQRLNTLFNQKNNTIYGLYLPTKFKFPILRKINY
jgi:hypothetical protein